MTLDDLTTLELTYGPVGATRSGAMPPGFHHLEVSGEIGRGQVAYRRAADGLMTFAMHRRATVHPRTSAPRAVAGVDFLGRLGIGSLSQAVPCRVVWAEEGERHTGFGYGTLPGHPEAGEEGFVVELHGDRVIATVRAYSRPATWYVRAAGALARWGQRLAAHLYLRMLRALASGVR